MLTLVNRGACGWGVTLRQGLRWNRRLPRSISGRGILGAVILQSVFPMSERRKNILIRTVAALYLAVLAIMTCFMFEWMFKLPTVQYHDFAKYYTAAKMLASSQGDKIYDLEYSNKIWREVSHEGESERPITMEFSPTYPLLLFSFGKLNISDAYPIWQALWISCGCIGLFSLLRSIHGASGMWVNFFRTFILFVATMASLPEARGMVLGQPCWLILGFTSGFCSAFVAKRDIAAGIMLAISTVKFQYSPFLAVAALAGKRWKLLAFAAVGFLLLSLGSMSLIGVDAFIHAPFAILKWDSMKELEVDINPQSMVNFRGVLSIFFGAESAMKCSIFIMIAGLMLTLKIWLDAVKIGTRAVPWALSFTVAAFLLFSAHVHMYECVVLSICPALTFPTFDPVRLLAVRMWSMRLWICLLVSYPLLIWVVFFLDVKVLHFNPIGTNLSVLTVLALNLVNVALLVLAAVNLYKTREACESKPLLANQEV